MVEIEVKVTSSSQKLSESVEERFMALNGHELQRMCDQKLEGDHE